MVLKQIREKILHVVSLSFFRSSVVYLSGNVLNAALPMLLLPVLTRYLTPTDYGIVATSTVLLQIFTVVLGLNAFGLISRSHFDHNEQSLQRLVSTSILLALILSGFLFLVILPTSSVLESLTKFPASWTAVLVVVALSGVIQTTYLAIVQARGEPGKYVRLQIAATALNLILSVLLVVSLGMDWRGRMLAIVATGVVMAMVSLYGLRFRLKLIRVDFDRGSLRSLLSFGIPLIPHFIGGWVMTMVARLYLNNMATVADTGLYSVGFNIASPVALLVGAADQAYVPALFSILSNEKALNKLRLARLLLLGALVLPMLAICYGLAVSLFVPLLVGSRFYGASEYVLWLGLGFAIQGVYFIFGNFVVYSKRTSLMSWRADFLGGIVMMIACPLLIQLNGPLGAAQATALAFAVSCLGCFTASRIAFPMPWKEALLSLVKPWSVSGSRNDPLPVTEKGIDR
jgi:O-antigen/teichoic acid export membrane protein